MPAAPSTWGEDYDRILLLMKSKLLPATDQSHNTIDQVFGGLEKKLQSLSEHEQQVFRHVFYETIGTKAALFHVLIDVYQGKCLSEDEAVNQGAEFIASPLG